MHAGNERIAPGTARGPWFSARVSGSHRCLLASLARISRPPELTHQSALELSDMLPASSTVPVAENESPKLTSAADESRTHKSPLLVLYYRACRPTCAPPREHTEELNLPQQ